MQHFYDLDWEDLLIKAGMLLLISFVAWLIWSTSNSPQKGKQSCTFIAGETFLYVCTTQEPK